MFRAKIKKTLNIKNFTYICWRGKEKQRAREKMHAIAACMSVCPSLFCNVLKSALEYVFVNF